MADGKHVLLEFTNRHFLNKAIAIFQVLGELSVIKTSIGEKDSQIQRLKGEIVILSEKLSDHLADELTRDQIDSASQVRFRSR